MPILRTTFVLLVLVPTFLVAQDPALLSPQPGVLLLRNGQLIEGEITPAGDQYIVTFHGGGEAKIAVKEVEARCADLEAVYDYKLRRLSGEGAGPHLDLAEWCLKQKLYRYCAEQLKLALAEEPDNKRIQQIETRLQLAVAAPAKPASSPVNSTIVAPEQLERTIRELPKGSLERFTTFVQPMLNNRCATSHCHGATSTNSLRLLRPPTGLGSPQRFTQRNLYAVLPFIDKNDPENSSLLTKAQEAHGDAKSPPIDPRNKAQLQELRSWVEYVANKQPPASLATIDPKAVPHLSTPQTTPPVESEKEATTAAPDNNGPAVRTASAPPPASPETSGQAKPWQPRDPFDPEIFNRRYKNR
jgi:hypothetical protein